MRANSKPRYKLYVDKFNFPRCAKRLPLIGGLSPHPWHWRGTSGVVAAHVDPMIATTSSGIHCTGGRANESKTTERLADL